MPTARPGMLIAAGERYIHRFFRRHFGALRVDRTGLPPSLHGPAVLYVNHPSWWDPIVLLLVVRACFPGWHFHGPVDARALERYPWLERFGLFGIEPGSIAGTRRFLQIGGTLLGLPRSGLAVTAQGSFTDVRERPLALKRGLARLLEQNPAAVAIPVALEYAFWNERLPEVLVRFGPERIAANTRAHGARDALDSRGALQANLEEALTRALDELAAASMTRDPTRFDCLIEGRRGIGLLQDLPYRIRALLTGQRFDPSHSALGRPR